MIRHQENVNIGRLTPDVGRYPQAETVCPAA